MRLCLSIKNSIPFTLVKIQNFRIIFSNVSVHFATLTFIIIFIFSDNYDLSCSLIKTQLIELFRSLALYLIFVALINKIEFCDIFMLYYE